MAKIKLSDKAIRQFRALPASIQAKTKKQFGYLLQDIRHPSLKAKKYKGHEDIWQARIDTARRFYFHIIEPEYVVVSIIIHPK